MKTIIAGGRGFKDFNRLIKELEPYEDKITGHADYEFY